MSVRGEMIVVVVVVIICIEMKSGKSKVPIR